MGNMFKNTALISALTLASRILGLIRDMVIAMVFGTTLSSDAFFVAFKPFDLARKLFSEGIFSISFIPVFSDLMKKQGKTQALSMLISLVAWLLLLTLGLIAAGFLLTPVIISLIAPGFSEAADAVHLAQASFRVMLPYIGFIMLTAVSMGVLNSFGQFGSPAAAPAVFNIVMILFCFLASLQPDPPVLLIALGVSAGGFWQLIIQVPAMIKLMVPVRFEFLNPAACTVLKRMIPCMVGAAAYQINIMVASFFASALSAGSVSSLYYADRLVQFPLALFVISVTTVFLPDLSDKVAQKDFHQVGDQFSKGVKMVLFVTIPAMFGLMALNREIVHLLFGRGAFDSEALTSTANCLFFLVTGLWAFSGVRLFITLYNALGNVRLPFYTGIFSVILNFILCGLFINSYGLSAAALAVTVSSAAGFLILLKGIPSRIGIRGGEIAVSACRSVFFSVMMFVLVKLIKGFMIPDTSGGIILGLGTAACILGGMISYFAISLIFSAPESQWIKAVWRQK